MSANSTPIPDQTPGPTPGQTPGPTPGVFSISWRCRHTWRRASYNTLWCLVGCAIGDLGTILFF